MVMQSEALQQASPNALKAQQPMTNGRTDSGALPAGVSEPDIAWEMVKEECHDVLEQLPLTLQRNFTLMRDLDVQVAAHLQAIPSVLQEYLQLRVKMAQDVVMADAKPSDDATAAEAEAPGAAPRERPFSRASFSSASLTPITDSPSTRSASLPNSRNVQDDSTNILEDDEETEEPDTSFESHLPAPEAPSSTQLIGRVATLATDAVRGSLEKVNLANAAYAVIDRHVRALDLAIEEQEQAIAAGIRPGTRPAAIVIPKGSSPSHGHSHSYESNGLLALAEVASAVAEKTLESMQPLPSAGSTVLTWNDKEAPVEEKPIATRRKEASKPKAEQPKRDRKKRNAAAQEEAADPNEPTYCYCNRVSFGNMIACDGPNCKREWFHWECVGITRNPTVSKWYCRDCEGKVEPARKKRKR